MKKPGLKERMGPRASLLACISLIGLGLMARNFVGGPVGPSVAMILVVSGSIFGLFYLSKVVR